MSFQDHLLLSRRMPRRRRVGEYTIALTKGGVVRLIVCLHPSPFALCPSHTSASARCKYIIQLLKGESEAEAGSYNIQLDKVMLHFYAENSLSLLSHYNIQLLFLVAHPLDDMSVPVPSDIIIYNYQEAWNRRTAIRYHTHNSLGRNEKVNQSSTRYSTHNMNEVIKEDTKKQTLHSYNFLGERVDDHTVTHNNLLLEAVI